jgi:hypothetical protein
MHKNFAEWYRLVRIEPNGDMLKLRWAGIEEWSESLRENDDDVLETVRIFQGLPEVSSRELFLAVFRKHDPAFPQRNELELRVLAGAALVNCVEPPGDDEEHEGIRSALIAGAALEASRLRVTDPQLAEVVDAVARGLQAISRQQRKRTPLSVNLINPKAKKVAVEALKQLPTASDWAVLRTNVVPALQAVFDGIVQAEKVVADAAHNLRCADEETDILWWLEGGCSRDLNKPWSALKDEVPLTAAWELADLTDVALGPKDATAFLQRVVAATKGNNKAQPIQDYVNGVSDEWARARVANLPTKALDLAPLALALLQRSKSGAVSWQSFFEKTSGIAPSTQLTPDIAASQAYVEAVLLRTLAKTED